MLTLNDQGQRFISYPERNKDGRITTNFFHDLIIIYMLIHSEYEPKKFKEYVKSLIILNGADKEQENASPRSYWTHYIDRAKQILFETGIIEQKNRGLFTFSNNVIGTTDKYKVYLNSEETVRDGINHVVSILEESNSIQDLFEPNDLIDSRRRVLRSIVERRGQSNFRKDLLLAYNSRCAITDSNVVEILEAAHIIPYLGSITNRIENRLLLRSDLHTLFDLRLISIDAEKYRVIISELLAGTEYEIYNGQQIKLPNNTNQYPSKKALQKQRLEANL